MLLLYNIFFPVWFHGYFTCLKYRRFKELFRKNLINIDINIYLIKIYKDIKIYFNQQFEINYKSFIFNIISTC